MNSALSRGPGYEPTPLGTAFDRSGLRGYYIDFTSKTTSAPASDTNRVFPASLAQLGLGWWERWLLGEDRAQHEVLHVCRLLEQRGQRRGGELRWPVPVPAPKYGLSAGACSALSQGQAASLFVRAYGATGHDRYAVLAQQAVAPLLTGSRSELVSVDAAGPVLQEAPSVPASHILNGWISALWGVRDVAVVLGDEPARRDFDDGVESLRRHLSGYDAGWWSRYSLYPHALEDLAKPIYHRYHVDQLRAMHALTAIDEFEHTAARWAACDRPLNMGLAVMQKGVFALADGRRRRRWSAAQ